jgi:hypothetical protein
MELAFEVPTKHLPTLGQHNDYNFTLAHLVKDPAYLAHYQKSNKYTICDNSAFELSAPLSAEEIVSAAELLDADEIVAPDAFGSGQKTIAATKAFIKHLAVTGNLGKYKVMGVVQGSNVPDWINCMVHMRDNKHIDVIGFSYVGCKVFHADLTNARIQAVHLSTHSATGNLKKPIHLLGMGNNPIELKLQKKIPNVRSCDTSIPIVQGLSKNRLSAVSGLVGPKLARPDNYFDADINNEQMEAIVHNITTMKQWVAELPSA